MPEKKTCEKEHIQSTHALCNYSSLISIQLAFYSFSGSVKNNKKGGQARLYQLFKKVSHLSRNGQQVRLRDLSFIPDITAQPRPQTNCIQN